jgi:hypothetical protein
MDKFEPTPACHFLSNHTAMAKSMVAFEAQETSALFGSCLNTSDHIRLSDLAAKMGSKDPPEILVPTLASSDAAEFRITEALEVQVSDVTRRKHICENRFREARLSRNWYVAHINQKVDSSCLQRREKIADRASLVADCMQRR